MKLLKINKLLAIFSVAILTVTGCRKDDGAVPERVTATAVPTITTNVDVTGSQAIDLLNLADFSGKFKVAQYFPGSTPPTKVDIVVRKNGSNSNVKVFKAGITSLPSSQTVTAAEIATLFGTAIVLGDTYDFAPDIYLGERKFEAFPVTGIGTGSGHNGQPLYSEFARFAAICAFKSSEYAGNFLVTRDQWNDFGVGTVIPVTSVNAGRLSIVSPVNGATIFIDVNTGTNVVTIASQAWGDYKTTTNPALNDPTWPYGVASIRTNGVAASNYVKPCDKTIILATQFTVAAGTFTGPYALELKKQ